MEKSELAVLRNGLPKKYDESIGKEIGISASYVRYIMNGNSASPRLDVIDCAIRLAETHKEEIKSRTQKIKDLITK